MLWIAWIVPRPPMLWIAWIVPRPPSLLREDALPAPTIGAIDRSDANPADAMDTLPTSLSIATAPEPAPAEALSTVAPPENLTTLASIGEGSVILPINVNHEPIKVPYFPNQSNQSNHREDNQVIDDDCTEPLSAKSSSRLTPQVLDSLASLGKSSTLIGSPLTFDWLTGGEPALRLRTYGRCPECRAPVVKWNDILVCYFCEWEWRGDPKNAPISPQNGRNLGNGGNSADAPSGDGRNGAGAPSGGNLSGGNSGGNSRHGYQLPPAEVTTHEVTSYHPPAEVTTHEVTTHEVTTRKVTTRELPTRRDALDTAILSYLERGERPPVNWRGNSKFPM